MAKLFYGPDYGTISVRADDEEPSDSDIEVTAEQANAVATWQVAQAISNLYSVFEDMAANLPGRDK
jgi:hypothetical protein